MKYSALAKAGIGLALLLVFLTACGQPKETRADIFNPNGIKVMPVRDSFGQMVNVPISPKRIAVTDQRAMDYLNALDATVSLAAKPEGGDYTFPPYTGQEQRDSLTLIETANGTLDPSALAAQKPDLIFTDNSDRSAYDALSKIAPTVYIDPTLDWRSELYMYSTFLDRDTIARQYMNAYQKDSNSAKSTIAAANPGTIAAVMMQNKALQVYGSTQHGTGAVLYQDLALKAPAGIPSSTASTTITMAQLQQLNPDTLFIATDQKDDTVAALNKRMAATADGAAWSGLKAVQNGHMYIVNRAFFNDTPLAKSYVIQTIADKLSAK
ncbi:ABC transporter substrate-binding protein [Paenibacillus sp. SGZ-1009]|uniref:ABC transporter substrate-binding protein n=1 Tax=Paenibacillus campi TaxID=3106031 RepID=UPI002B002426|nr:ABC transporter substrate-binding protein [Paenibacillus sp. SGZ-1009]